MENADSQADNKSDVNGATMTASIHPTRKYKKRQLSIQEAIVRALAYLVEIYGDAATNTIVEEPGSLHFSFHSFQIVLGFDPDVNPKTNGTSEPVYERKLKQFAINKKSGDVENMINAQCTVAKKYRVNTL